MMQPWAKTKIIQTRLKDCHLTAKGKKEVCAIRKDKCQRQRKQTHTQYIYIYIYAKGAIVPKLPTKAQKHTGHHKKIILIITGANKRKGASGHSFVPTNNINGSVN